MGQANGKPCCSPGEVGVNPASDPGPRRTHQSESGSQLPKSKSSHSPPLLSASTSYIQPPKTSLAPVASQSAGSIRSKTIGRKFSIKTACPKNSGKEALVTQSRKSRRTLGEEMRAFEELVEAAEARSGITPERSTATRLDYTPPNSAKPAASPLIAHGVSKSMDGSLDFLTSPSGVLHATAKVTRSHTLRQRSMGSRSPPRPVSIKSTKRAEREWRAKVAAISSSSSAPAAAAAGERDRRRSGLPLRGGPVPPRRTPARATTADASFGASSTPSSAVVTPPRLTVSSPMPDDFASNDLAHESPLGYGKGLGVAAKSILSRRSFETLGRHHVSPDCSPEAPSRARRNSLHKTVVSSFLIDEDLHLSTRRSSFAAGSLLSPEEGQATSDSIARKAVDEEVLRSPLPLDTSFAILGSPVADSPILTPDPQMMTTSIRSAKLAAAGSTRSKRPSTADAANSHCIGRSSPLSIRSNRNSLPSSMIVPSISSMAISGCPSPSPPSSIHDDGPALSKTAATHAILLPPLILDDPRPCSPITTYTLSTPAENISFQDILMATPPLRGDIHPYATKVSSSPESAASPPSAMDKASFGPHPRWNQTLSTAPPLIASRAMPSARARPRTPLGPSSRIQVQVALPSALMKTQMLGPRTTLQKGVRGVDLTPGMESGQRPPKSGMPMSDLERWVAGMSIES